MPWYLWCLCTMTHFAAYGLGCARRTSYVRDREAGFSLGRAEGFDAGYAAAHPDIASPTAPGILA